MLNNLQTERIAQDLGVGVHGRRDLGKSYHNGWQIKSP